MNQLTPKQIVTELNKYIVGQHKAKKAVAIALRNRWRRQNVDSELRAEITPKNILMVGPTGVGKTEIARRLAKLADAPFIKVEATKFTEVGYVGRDVDSIIRDLIETAIKQMRENEKIKNRKKAEDLAEERILDILVPGLSDQTTDESLDNENGTRQIFRKRLREKLLDDKIIELEVSIPTSMDIICPPGMEEMTEQIRGLFSNISNKKTARKLPIKEAMQILIEEESEKLLDEKVIKEQALRRTEENGIVFIDEIDKIAVHGEKTGGGEISRQGVQRDLLPLVEGTTVNTKYGPCKTDHILFIASGAFHFSKPSDLIPELQGRLPIRVELESLSIDDFESILKSTDASLTKQYYALLNTENIKLNFSEDGIRQLAVIAYDFNTKSENIGARRLYTLMEKLLESISFNPEEYAGQTININSDFVEKAIQKNINDDNELSHYIL